MSDRPWYKRYGGDFVLGTMSLTLEEKGAYSLCLDLIYDRGAPIPDDERWLAGVCGVSVRRWRVIRDRLIEIGKLSANGGKLSNERAEKELENSAKTSREHVENGASGGRKRAENAASSKENSNLGQAGLKPRARVLPEPEPESVSEANASSTDRPPPAADPLADALRAYNVVAEEVGLPLARGLTAERKKHLRQRLAEHGTAGWLAAMDGLRAPFCRGENDRGWKANLDFALQAKSCAKLAENAYASGQTGPPMTAGMLSAASDELAFRIATGQVNGTENRNPLRDQGAVVALPAPLARHG